LLEQNTPPGSIDDLHIPRKRRDSGLARSEHEAAVAGNARDLSFVDRDAHERAALARYLELLRTGG